MIKGSIAVLLLLGLITLETLAQKINLRPYIIDVPQTQIDHDFIDYIAKYNKQYQSTTEFNFRKEIYKRNLQVMDLKKPTSKNYQVGPNFFADQTPAELITRFKYTPPKTLSEGRREHKLYDIVDLPKSKNWITDGAVTEVKNQGYCGSSWAYAAASAIESAHFVIERELVPLSTQQLIDCVPSTAGNGCGSIQSVDDVFAYAKDNLVMKESDYPTTGKSSDKCYDDKDKGLIQLQSVIYPTPKNPTQLLQAINEGPTIAVVNADIDFVFYQSGILDSDDCTSTILQPVLIVGYGTENDIDYYLVKNSWGTQWGENGYARIAIKNDVGVCGIQTDLILPISN